MGATGGAEHSLEGCARATTSIEQWTKRERNGAQHREESDQYRERKPASCFDDMIGSYGK